MTPEQMIALVCRRGHGPYLISDKDCVGPRVCECGDLFDEYPVELPADPSTPRSGFGKYFQDVVVPDPFMGNHPVGLRTNRNGIVLRIGIGGPRPEDVVVGIVTEPVDLGCPCEGCRRYRQSRERRAQEDGRTDT